MADKKSYTPQAPQAVMSLEGIFITHLFSYIDRLQEAWMGEDSSGFDGFNIHKFEHQVLFLIRLLPDKKKQEDIMNAWMGGIRDDEKKWKNMETNQRVAFAGMEAVTEIILFICSAFDLIHTDVTGPATNKQYLKEAVAVSDMPVELVAKFSPPTAALPALIEIPAPSDGSTIEDYHPLVETREEEKSAYDTGEEVTFS